MSKSRFLCIKSDGNVFWTFFIKELQDHFAETEYGVGGKPLGIGEVPNGMIGAVDV
jgi:hypothetical protein